SGPETRLLQHALAEGAGSWLPRDLVLDQPDLLADGLRHVLKRNLHSRQARRAERRARLYRTQVNRLADLVWTSLPVAGRPGWLAQRYLLERLAEEVLRS